MKTKNLAILFMIATLLVSCGNKKNDKSDSKAQELATKGGEWLKLVFTCPDNENAFCFPDEESICSERYYAYYSEYMTTFEYPDFETEAEQKAAEQKFKSKWKDMYPAVEELWSPFGRGNGVEMGYPLKNVTITPLKELEYRVVVDYGDGNVFSNEVKLVPFDDVFQVDYIKTQFVK